MSETLVVSALAEETEALVERLASRATSRVGRIALERGSIAGVPVAVAATGDGAANAGERLAALLAALEVRDVLAVGVGGALTEDLSIGDVVVGASILDDRGEEVGAPDPGRLRRALRHDDARGGRILTARAILTTAADKRRALRALPGEGPATVDLESAAWARACREAGVPLLVARSVSDVASEDLPLDFNRFLDDRGSVRRGAVARHLVFRPGKMPALLALRDRLRTCAVRLSAFVEHAVGPG